MARQIIVRVDPQGNAKIDVKGMTGRSCVEATRPLEEMLGDAGKRTEKPEMALEEASVQQELQT